MALALEVEFLSGVAYAAWGPDSGAPDWPPQPDRVFSALVATWGAHGEPQDERLALEWLESQPCPQLQASPGAARSAPLAYVPPNDPSVDRSKLAGTVLPALRRRQPRRFPAAVPDQPTVRHFWAQEPDEATMAALRRLAQDTSYVGHSASLTRCRFSSAAMPEPAALQWPRRQIYPGRLSELRQAHVRFLQTANKSFRPSPGPIVEPPRQTVEPARGAFSRQWLVLEHQGGEMPDLRAAAIVARGIRVALMSGYGQLGEPVPKVISGHEPDGSPARTPHLAVVPLPYAGFEHADGRVLGFALVPPAGSALFEDPLFLKVLRRLTAMEHPGARRLLSLRLPPLGASPLQLAPLMDVDSGKASLNPARFLGDPRSPATDYASLTPILLDRHPKASNAEQRQQEMAEDVASACLRAGLPAPATVRVDKHALPTGAPSAYPSSGMPPWMRWRLPKSLEGRVLTHAVIRFAQPVPGPVLIGAGRFVGLGLCLPLGRGGRDAAA